ncbi:ABC transporter permease [Streptomyces sp. NPDC053755]|uniref:ABC transporter permease n=1 Tax=Streptomyces sp. NPDC053755 TaxID=3155815 RepID=UPI00344881C5
MPANGTRKTLAVMVLIPVVAALALWAFAWPAARVAPHDLPIGVAGPAAAAAPLEERLAERDGAFEVHRFDSEAAARTAIEDRVVYGAVVVTPQGPRLLTASAASPVVAGLLREAVTAQVPAGTQVEVVDVVSTPAGDPRGSAFGSSLFPLVLAGTAAGIVITVMGLRRGRAVLALCGAAALAGIVGAGLAHTWLGALTGDWWAEAGVLALTVLAIGSALAGLAALLGRAGFALGAPLMVLFGNPFSGVASAPELLPAPAGALGQLLPPGAGGSALRSVAFFDGAGAGSPLLVLGVWVALGLAAVALGGRRTRAAAEPGPAPAPRPAPVG